ncbi:MAG: serine kinase [Chlorobiaceae bacterium]|nr:serine kinase [Chlorobiaceae bacterium]
MAVPEPTAFLSADSQESLALSLLEAVTTLDRSRLHLRRFTLPGLVIDAWFSNVAYGDLCTRNLAHGRMPDIGSSADLTLYLLDSDSMNWPQPPRWAEKLFDRKAANSELARIGLKGAYQHDPRVWQFFSQSRRTGVQLVRRPGAHPPWESGGTLRSFLHWAYAAQGRRLCHCATLGVNGKGIVLVGAGGSGKSGTTLAGIANGLETTGDDYCLIDQSETVTAYPLFRILKQDAPGVIRVLGSSATERFGPLNWQDKYEIHESALPRSPFVAELDIRAIVVPRIAHLARTIIRPVSAGHAMRSFAPSSTFQLPDGEVEGIAFAGRLCRTLPCMEMLLSEESSEIAATLHNFLKHQRS